MDFVSIHTWITTLVRKAMPELPDVEVFRQHAEKHAMNKTIRGVAYNDAGKLLKSPEQTISRALKGQKFTRSSRTGKHMFLKTGEDRWLAMHFGMTGYLKYWKDTDKRSDFSKVIIGFEEGSNLSFVSKRKLGEMKITDDPEDYRRENGLGMDALDIPFSEFRKSLEDKRGSIKNVLMDQSRVSGIGNIYSDEILFQEKWHPKQRFEKLDEEALRSLHKTIHRVLKTAINRDARPSDLPANYLLPNREEGKKCPACEGKISKIKINGRGVYFCPDCQKL